MPNSRFFKTIIFFIPTFLLFSNIFAEEKTQDMFTVAVLEFEGRGLSPNEAGPLTDRFRGELVKTNMFTVLEREQMQAIFNEIGFQMTGCTSTECAVEAGKILNVRKIVVGKIGKVGNTYTVDISTIDIQTSRIEASANRDHVGIIDGLLPILRTIAIEIALRYTKPPKPISQIPLYISAITTLGALGTVTYSYIQAENAYDNYQKAMIGEDAAKYMDDTEYYDNITLISGVTAGVSAVFYYFYRRAWKKSKLPEGFSASIHYDEKEYRLSLNIAF